MPVVTVCGEMDAARLGYTLPHEHLLCDLRSMVAPYTEITRRNAFMQRVSLQNHGLLTRNPYSVLDNAVLDDIDIQREEALCFLRAGGDTIVDVTPRELGRDPQFLYGLSRETGLNIVMGCGHYLKCMHPGEVHEKSVRELADGIIHELTVGVDDTGIRAGVIGEIGTGNTIDADEYKALEAASIAQREVGCGMHIHCSLWNRNGLDAASFAIGHGASEEKICIDHVDVVLDIGYIRAALDMGILVEFDDFGKEFYVDRRYRNLLDGSFATDRDRVQRLRELIDAGYEKQLLVSNDICLKTLTHYYGGWGYDHILTNIRPMMLDYGISEACADGILKDNPARFLEQ